MLQEGAPARLRSYLIADLPERERPREKLFRRGAEYLSDVELLALILRSGPAGRSTLDLAGDLLRHFSGSLAELANAEPSEFTRVKGIGPAKAAELTATFMLARRLSDHVEAAKPRVSAPTDVADYFRERLRARKQEELYALFLDTKNRVIRDALITKGLLDRSQIHAREVFRGAIQYSASRLILAHNHPSGDPTPSAADIACTKELVVSGRVIGIEVVDHIILGARSALRPRDYLSLREEKLM